MGAVFADTGYWIALWNPETLSTRLRQLYLNPSGSRTS